MAGFQGFMYGRFWVFTEALRTDPGRYTHRERWLVAPVPALAEMDDSLHFVAPSRIAGVAVDDFHSAERLGLLPLGVR